MARQIEGQFPRGPRFTGNRNQQHAFLTVWTALKWADHHIVPNLEAGGREHGISRRTLQRIRAMMRRLELIDHISRFNGKYGGRDGWVLSGRFERALRLPAEKVADVKHTAGGSREKDTRQREWTEARRRLAGTADVDAS